MDIKTKIFFLPAFAGQVQFILLTSVLGDGLTFLKPATCRLLQFIFMGWGQAFHRLNFLITFVRGDSDVAVNPHKNKFQKALSLAATAADS